MERSYLEIVTSPGMWLVSAIVVIIVIAQAVIFMKKAHRAGKEMGMNDEQLKSAVRSGAIATIGPAFAIMIAMISVLPIIGGPFTWLRFSVVGSVPFEILAYETGAAAAGVTLASPDYDINAFAASAWTATLGAAGWMVIAALFTDKFDLLRKKAVRGNVAILPVLSISAMIGAFAFFGVPHIAARGLPSSAAYFGGAIVMVVLNLLASKMKSNWLKEWSLGIAMLCGMLAALIFV